jgi:hypothetical protein
MTASAIARRIEMTGWSTVMLGVVCLILAALQAVVPILLTRIAESTDAASDPLRGMRDAWSAGAALGAIVNGAFGAALSVIGVGVARRASWAHRALTIACWASIAVLAVLAKPTLAPFFALAGDDASTGRGLLIAGVLLLVAQIAAVLWFLRFWRKPEVREAFR